MNTIIKLNKTHIDTICAFENKVYEHPWSKKVITGCFDLPNHFLWGIQSKSELVGYIICHLVLDEAHLLNIAIEPSSQGLGLAQKLILFAENELATLGAKAMFLEVRASNKKAISVYQKLGYQKIDVRKGYYRKGDMREDAVVMKKTIGQEVIE